jgi:uncharacterized protein YegP (UPF0339 family)
MSHNLKFELFLTKNHHWAWHLRAGNNRIIAYSGEGYFNQQDAIHGFNLLRHNMANLRYEVIPTENRQWTWHLKAANNKIVAYAGETYHNKEDAIHSLNLVIEHVSLVTV